MFFDRTIAVGVIVSLFGMVLAVAAYAVVLASISVEQDVRLVGVAPSPGSIVLDDIGDSTRLSVRGYYSDRSFGDLDQSAVTYTSTDPSVARVDENGNVAAMDSGTADVMVRHAGFSKRVPVTVLGEMTMPPPINPDMVGVLPELGLEAEVVLNRVMVELVPGYDVDDAQDIASTFGGEVIFSFRTFPGHLIQFNPFTHRLPDILSDVANNRIVEAAYPDVLIEVSDHPIDTLIGAGTPPRYDGSEYTLAGFERAWRIIERIDDLDPVAIAMIDSGMLPEDGAAPPFTRHDLSAAFDWNNISIIPEPDSTSTTRDDVFHGTAVASVMVAANNEGADPLSGVVTSPGNVRYNFLAFAGGVVAGTMGRTMSTSGTTAAYENLHDVRDNVDVVNLSFGTDLIRGLGLQPPLDISEIKENFGFYSARFDIVEDMSHVTFVPAAGNDYGVDALQIFPARWSVSLPNVITVGGADRQSYTPYGSIGPAVTLGAPHNVLVVHVDEAQTGYFDLSGTSFAAPMVTGTVALLKAIWPGLTPTEVKEILVESADKKTLCSSADFPCPASDEQEWSILDAGAAVDELLSQIVDAQVRVNSRQQVSGGYAAIDVGVENTGQRTWPFYAEAWVRSPSGEEVQLDSVENVVAAQSSHPFRWGFWANESGLWDLKVRVSRDDTGSTELALSDWGEAVIEVLAPTSAPQPGAPPTPVPSTPGGALQADANVILLADTSGSMEGLKIESLRESVIEFANRVDDPGEFVSLIDFDSDFRQLIPLGPMGTDLGVWTDAVDMLDGDGGTAFFDAVIQAVSVLESDGAPDRTNIIIALTDGDDQDSRRTLDDAISALRQSQVPILLFAIAYGEPGDYELGPLEALAEATGGAAYTADPVDLDRLYTLLSTIF